MTPDDPSSDADLRTLRAITLLKTEIVAQINAGLTSLQVCIAQLTEAHHRSMLDQERRNATFAPQTRLEELISQVHGHSNKIQEVDTKTFLLDQSLSTVKTQLRDDEQSSHNRSFGLLTTTAGWVFSIVMALVMLGLGILVSHIH